MHWASLSLQGDVTYGQCRFLRSIATQANPPPYSVPVQTNGTPYGCGERTGPWRHMPCSGHRCPCRAMSLMASAASCVQLPRRLTHHHTVCRCRPMAHRMAVERGQDRGGTCHALGIAVLAGRCRLWPVPLLAFNCHAG